MKEDKEFCLLCVNKRTESVDNSPVYNDLIERRKREIEEILLSFVETPEEKAEILEQLWENFNIKVIK